MKSKPVAGATAASSASVEATGAGFEALETLAMLRSPRAAQAATMDPTWLSEVAHELRGPLTAMATSSELLVDDLEQLDPAQIRDMVATIHRGAVWLQGLVENLLCAASIRDGRFSVRRQPVSGIDIALDVDRLIRPLLTQKGQRLRISTRGELPHFPADRRRMTQALMNLVLNANKYAGGGTAIDISVVRRGAAVRITVADRGPGLPPGSASQLFEPFYRASDAIASGKEGVGLGLSLVKSITEAHGGRVGAEKRRGGGACFWFELPVSPAF